MDRRSFLKLFAAAAPVAAVAPTYFFAPVGGWHSDVIVHAPPTVMGVQQRLNAAMDRIDDYMNRVKRGTEEHIFHATRAGIYDNGVKISKDINPELLYGLPYWQVRPPYLSDTYLGISRS